MAYQPKSYRKFIAGAAVAAVVVPAVATPAFAASFTDVSASYQEAVDFLVSKGINGTTETTFGTQENIKRVDAAVMVAKVLNLDLEAAPAAGFTDVPARAVKEVNALKAAGITSGKTETTFGAQDLITRGELAIWIQKGFKLKGNNDALAFNDVADRYAEAVAALVANEITSGTTQTTFGTYDNAKRGDFAKFLLRADQATAVLSVDDVVATNSKTLKITGTALDQLTTEGITVADNSVAALEVAEDGKTATVTLSSELVMDETTEVTILDTKFEVLYKVEASGVSVVEATYDDDTKDQFVAIKVNGNRVTTQELIAAGYDITFEAYENKSATVDADIFDNPNTGELKVDLTDVFTDIPASGEEVYVKVKLTKGAEVLTSQLTKIVIKNIDLAADSITAFELTNNATGFEQNSTTLVAGETAKFTEITVKSASNEDDVTSGFTVKSSDESVISVDEDNEYELTAQGPGTATITITYGGATYTKTFKVENEERKEAKVQADKTSVTVAENDTKAVKFKLLDQYGDPMVIDGDVVVTPGSSDTNKVTVEGGLELVNETEGEYEFKVFGKDTGSAIITFRDDNEYKIGTTSVKVTVSNNTTLSKYELKADTEISDGDLTKVKQHDADAIKDQVSTDSTIDSGDDKYLLVNLKAFNNAGAELAKPEAGVDYTVEINQSKADVIASVYEGNGFLIVEAGEEEGTATITVTSEENKNIEATIRVNVEEVGYDVTKATFKNVSAVDYEQNLNYKDFLQYTEGANDPIISGITLSQSVAQPVRLDSTGSLYVDKNANGVFSTDEGDFVVGSVALTGTKDYNNDYDVITGVDAVRGNEGLIIFKVLDTKDRVVATKSIDAEF